MTVKTALILAAGVGSRMGDVGEDIPKCLLHVGDKPLMWYSLTALSRHGVEDVHIIVGYKKEMIMKELGDSFNGMRLLYIDNPVYDTTGSARSLSCAEGIIDEPFYLLEADILYEPSAIAALRDAPDDNILFVVPLSGSGDEVFAGLDDRGYLNHLKKRDKPDNCAGEMLGIWKLSPEILKRTFELAKQDYDKGEMNRLYEYVIFDAGRDFPIKCVCKDIAWTEVDDEKDLKRAWKDVYPKVKDLF